MYISAAINLIRAESLTVLGITFNTKLCFESHISFIIQSAARCLYDLKTLRAHGLTGAYWEVYVGCHSGHTDCKDYLCCTRMVGFLTVVEKERIESVVQKANATATYQVTLNMCILWWKVWLRRQQFHQEEFPA